MSFSLGTIYSLFYGKYAGNENNHRLKLDIQPLFKEEYRTVDGKSIYMQSFFQKNPKIEGESTGLLPEDIIRLHSGWQNDKNLSRFLNNAPGASKAYSHKVYDYFKEDSSRFQSLVNRTRELYEYKLENIADEVISTYKEVFEAEFIKSSHCKPKPISSQTFNKVFSFIGNDIYKAVSVMIVHALVFQLHSDIWDLIIPSKKTPVEESGETSDKEAPESSSNASQESSEEASDAVSKKGAKKLKDPLFHGKSTNYNSWTSESYESQYSFHSQSSHDNDLNPEHVSISEKTTLPMPLASTIALYLLCAWTDLIFYEGVYTKTVKCNLLSLILGITLCILFACSKKELYRISPLFYPIGILMTLLLWTPLGIYTNGVIEWIAYRNVYLFRPSSILFLTYLALHAKINSINIRARWLDLISVLLYAFTMFLLVIKGYSETLSLAIIIILYTICKEKKTFKRIPLILISCQGIWAGISSTIRHWKYAETPTLPQPWLDALTELPISGKGFYSGTIRDSVYFTADGILILLFEEGGLLFILLIVAVYSILCTFLFKAFRVVKSTNDTFAENLCFLIGCHWSIASLLGIITPFILTNTTMLPLLGDLNPVHRIFYFLELAFVLNILKTHIKQNES